MAPERKEHVLKNRDYNLSSEFTISTFSQNPPPPPLEGLLSPRPSSSAQLLPQAGLGPKLSTGAPPAEEERAQTPTLPHVLLP